MASSAERYLCTSHRLAGDTALILGTRGAPSGRAFALNARLRSGSELSVPAAGHLLSAARRAVIYYLISSAKQPEKGMSLPPFS